MLLFEFDIVFVVWRAIKGQTIDNYLVDQPLNDQDFLEFLFLDEDVLAIEPKLSNVESWHWKLYFDGVANTIGNGVGAVLVSLKGQKIPIFVKLNFDCMNNVTKYEACIVGLRAALEFSTYDLSVFGVDHLPGRRKVASLGYQVDSVSEMC